MFNQEIFLHINHSSGGMAREATVFYKRLAERVSQKREESYSVVMGWL